MAVSFSCFHIIAGFRSQVTGDRCTRTLVLVHTDGMFGLCGVVWAVGGYAPPASTPMIAHPTTIRGLIVGVIYRV